MPGAEPKEPPAKASDGQPAEPKIEYNVGGGNAQGGEGNANANANGITYIRATPIHSLITG
jgi:hypothetical protein